MRGRLSRSSSSSAVAALSAHRGPRPGRTRRPRPRRRLRSRHRPARGGRAGATGTGVDPSPRCSRWAGSSSRGRSASASRSEGRAAPRRRCQRQPSPGRWPRSTTGPTSPGGIAEAPPRAPTGGSPPRRSSVARPRAPPAWPATAGPTTRREAFAGLMPSRRLRRPPRRAPPRLRPRRGRHRPGHPPVGGRPGSATRWGRWSTWSWWRPGRPGPARGAAPACRTLARDCVVRSWYLAGSLAASASSAWAERALASVKSLGDLLEHRAHRLRHLAGRGRARGIGPAEALLARVRRLPEHRDQRLLERLPDRRLALEVDDDVLEARHAWSGSRSRRRAGCRRGRRRSGRT